MRNTPQPTARRTKKAEEYSDATLTEPDELVSDRNVAKELGGISLMTLQHRWSTDPKLEFPPPIKIRNKNFRSRRALEEFKARMMRAAVTQRVEAK
jgi:hypothetical protein